MTANRNGTEKPNRNLRNRTACGLPQNCRNRNRRNRNRGFGSFEPIPQTIQMGITGVPFGRTEVLVPPLEPHERTLARGNGPRGPGFKRFKEKCKPVSFFGICTVSKNSWKQITKFVRFARIEITSMQDESPHRVSDSPGVFGPLFEEKKGKTKETIFQVFQIVLISPANPHTNGWAPNDTTKRSKIQ